MKALLLGSALLASAVAAFFYLRVIVLMYFSPPAADGPTVGVPGIPTTGKPFRCSSQAPL